MPFTPEQDTAIRAALSKKVVGRCPMCQNRSWSIVNDIVAFKLPSLERRDKNPNLPPPLQEVMARTVVVPRSLPCIVTICNICGLMQFHNVFTLGIHTLLGIAPEEQVQHG
jgi:hypothetical protein